MKPVHATHITTSISRLGGGLFESVRHLSLQTQKNGVNVEILGLQDKHTDEDAARWSPLAIRVFPVSGPPMFGYSPELSRHLDKSPADVLHLHGIWQYPTSAVLRWARLTGKPYMVSAHGMLEPWALQRSRFKKAMVNWLYQSTCLQEASCLRATAASEIESIRRLGLKNPVALIPNGVPVPEILPPQSPPEPQRKNRALFLSRIHPKKGLLNLVRAWRRVNPAGWELVLIGPDEGGHLAEVLALVRECGFQNQISYGGEIWDEAGKWKCYASADIFVLPSFSENFGLVIAEALGCGVPVITTRATPWRDLETHQCGWWIDTGEEPLVKTLKEALALPPGKLREMGLRGRRIVQTKYSWTPIGKQMAETYEWLAGRRPRPECVDG
jgi:glycosyltransferase involved in cell wall biosynthesis